VLVSLGVACVVVSIVGQHVAFRRVFRAWRVVEPRKWASVVHPTRRAFPFSSFRWSITTEVYERQWFVRTPEWARRSADARRWLRLYRFSALLFPIGFFVVVAHYL
jgi:hypothetical protein